MTAALLSATSVAAFLDMTVAQVYAAARIGQLGPVVKIGRRVRFHRHHIEALAEDRTRRGSLHRSKAGSGAGE